MAEQSLHDAKHDARIDYIEMAATDIHGSSLTARSYLGFASGFLLRS